LVIRQHRSSIGEKIAARRTLEALGLRRTGQTVEQTDSQAVRGMLRRVAHLVEVNDSQQPASSEKSGKSANSGPATESHRHANPETSGTEVRP
jgi:large subunit ribosomal protein L30